MTNNFAISVMAEDRVGIIHAVSQKISEMGGDIADLSQTVLSSYFAMILLTSLPDDVTEGVLLSGLKSAEADVGVSLDVSIKALDTLPTKQPAQPADAYVLTASGTDRIGFVAAVTGFCAEHGINILDLDTRAADGTYLMILLVDPGPADLTTLQQEIREFSTQQNMSVTLQHHDVFQATQEVRMPL
ncbi:MAG: ACT domain-containing protein [Chloroflexota bacterium]